MTKILITGGAGFIGSHTCLVLLEAGHELGWWARIPLAEGLASTVVLFRDQLSLQLARL